jgi:hypothetical protein
MKKILLLMMCCPMILSAQNGVTVSNLVANSGTVTFNVSWKSAGMPAPWSDSVWVFVDYNHAGRMERLPLSGATLSVPTWSAATVIFGKDGNKQGAWVMGNARSAGSFSATVRLLTDITDVAGVCAYASNYPPVGTYRAENTRIEFTGTPMYKMVLKKSGGSGTLTDFSDGSYTIREGYTVTSFTDKTGAPGTLIVPPAQFPPNAATTLTWTFGSSTLVWSDYVNKTLDLCDYADPPVSVVYGNKYSITDGKYYYNYSCAANSSSTLCPSPWRLPLVADFQAEKTLGNHTLMLNAWPKTGLKNTTSTAALHTTEIYMPSRDWVGSQYGGWRVYSGGIEHHNPGYGDQMVVRCVRDKQL